MVVLSYSLRQKLFYDCNFHEQFSTKGVSLTTVMSQNLDSKCRNVSFTDGV